MHFIYGLAIIGRHSLDTMHLQGLRVDLYLRNFDDWSHFLRESARVRAPCAFHLRNCDHGSNLLR